MRNYFYEQISKCFDNVIFTQFGSVAVSLYSYKDGNGNDIAIKYVAYDIPSAELSKLTDEEQENHIKLEKTYDISNVNFNEKMSVLQKIHDLVGSFEIEVYS